MKPQPIVVQTFLLGVLLCIFVSAWILARPRVIPMAEPPKDPPRLSDLNPRTESPLPPPALETSLARDPFRIPEPLEQILLEKSTGPSLLPAPVHPEPVKVIDPPRLTLQGLFWGIEHPQAIIDRKIVSAGERLGEAQVVDITSEGIQILYQGGNFFYRPGSDQIERMTKER